MLTIVWLHDDRDHPKGIDGLRIEDLPTLTSRLPAGARLVAARAGQSGDSVGAVLIRLRDERSFEQLGSNRYAIAEGLQTELWIREWSAQAWCHHARRVLGPAFTPPVAA